METENLTSTILTPEELLEHWQGHRRLTRRVIETFPDDELFDHSIGGMRPFAEMAKELIGMEGMGMHGVAEGDWQSPEELNYNSETSALSAVQTKKGLLNFWDQVTEEINTYWSQIPEGRFREIELAWGNSDWGGFESPVWGHIFYFIDNEIHHRGQGYVYLRSLDIEPPYFWERG